ncbi:unnamed protein product [Malus baccata var. baccata]
MRSFRNLHGFLKHLAAFTGICHHQSRKLSTKSIHFLNRIYPHKPNNPIPRKNTKNHPNPLQSNNLWTQDLHARNRRKHYRILKYSTWDSAKEQQHSLPIRWDSYTVS